MNASERMGRRAEAVAVYQRCKKAFAADGIEPSAATEVISLSVHRMQPVEKFGRDGMRTGISALKYDGVSWGAAAALETGTGNVYGSFVSPNGKGYTAIWSQVEETDPLVTNIQTREF